MRILLAATLLIALMGLRSADAAELKETWRIRTSSEFSPELVCPSTRAKAASSTTSTHADLGPPDVEELAALGSIPELPGSAEPLKPIERDAAGPIAVAIWGDSHTAAGFFTEQLLESIGLEQDDVAPSFVPATASRPGVRLPIQKSCRGGPWETDLAYTSSEFSPTFSRSLSATRNTGPGAYLWIDFRRGTFAPNLKQLKVLFTLPADSSSAEVHLEVDERASRTFRLVERHTQIVIEGDRPFATVKLRVESGRVKVDGFVPSYTTEPKLILDTLSIPGATARAWRVIDTKFMRRWGPKESYDLAFLQYGTNEGNVSPFNFETYRDSLRESLRGFRSAYPNASCVLIGPPDRGVLVKKRGKGKSRGKVAPAKDLLFYSRVHLGISDVQLKVGREFGCSFWSWQKVMGGVGGMYRWQRSQPPRATSDLIHLTKHGYQESARRCERDLGLKEALGF